MRKALIALVLASALAIVAMASGRTSPSTSTTAAGISCTKSALRLVEGGQLTIGTDNPAFSPWFGGGEREGSPWQLNDPATGQGYESAVAYEVAKRLGFTRAEVEWIAVPFNRSFAPGRKPFDFFINQVSITEERRRNVAFSISYYNVNQAVVGIEGTPITRVRFVAGLRPYKLGAPVGTTSFDYITRFIRPNEEPSVFDTLNDGVTALRNRQIDGLVVDFPTTGFITGVQVQNAEVVGRLPTRGPQEHFGIVLQKNNSLVACVNRSLARMRRDGTLRRLEQKWLGRVGGASVLK